jgi:hypothetical protein
MAGIHRSLNLALAAVGFVVAGVTMAHLFASVEAARLAGAFAIGVLGWLVMVRFLRQTS